MGFNLDSTEKKVVIFALLFLFLIGVVASAPPVTQVQQFTEGFLIEDAGQPYLIEEAFYNYNFFLYNISSGGLINNDSTSCSFFLANATGDVVVIRNPIYDNTNRYWYTNISGGNFTRGKYYYGISCNDSTYGGAITGEWDVTKTGYELTEARAIVYVGLLALLIFALFGLFFGMSFLPASNQRDEDGKILSITYAKYFRLPLWLMAYFLFIAIMFLGSNVAFVYLGEELFGKTLFSIFAMGMAIAPAIVIVLMVYFFVKFFHDREFQRYLKRGVFPQEL